MDSSLPSATKARPALDLNEKNIKAAQPGDTLRDGTIRGLQLRCFPTKKVFYLYFRTKAGVERKPKLGAYGSITLAQARKVAQDMWQTIAAGGDPVLAQQEAKAEHTLDDLWAEVYKRHASKIKSGARQDANYKKHIQPKLGNKPLSKIDYSILSDFIDSLSATPILANRLRAQLSKMFSFGIHPLNWIDKHPVKHVAKNKETKRKRYMSSEEAATVAQLLHASSDRFPASVAFLYLLILTGARKSEIANSKWEWLHGNVLRLPDSKTGAKQIYLPPAAMDVINKLPRTSGTLTGIDDPKGLWDSIRNKAGCPDLRMHDLRHSFASVAISAGLSLAQIGELLGHKNAQTTMRYAHLMEDAAAAAVTATADQIMARMKLPV